MAMDAAGIYGGATGYDPNSLRLVIAKQAIAQLIEKYDTLGNVNVKITSFSSAGVEESSIWYVDQTTERLIILIHNRLHGGTSYM